MINKSEIEKIVNQELKGTDKFLVDLKMKNTNEILVVLDSDSGISVQDCIDLSRRIEGNFDRDLEDFKLDVSSYGITNPLKLKRQYRKNVGRNLKIRLKSGDQLKGKLLEVIKNHIVIERILSKKKKAKIAKEDLVVEILYDDIEESKIEISF